MSTWDGKNQFQITALQAQQFDLYRDGTYVKTFLGNTVIDNDTNHSQEHSYYIMAKNSTGETRSVLMTIPASPNMPILQQAG
ncbi:hypothetical protein CN404_30960 [Bacillus thuringiensis]|nr:hypothetical protein CN404_30960 [Bacillus thuringiensis]